MLNNLILFLFFYHYIKLSLLSWFFGGCFFFLFKKSDLNDMVFGRELGELGDIPPVRCVSGWNGYLWNAIISSNRLFFFKV